MPSAGAWPTIASATANLYRGRFKAFPVQSGQSLLEVLRYVERNALSAKLVERAQDWRWSSLWAREQADQDLTSILSPWPVARPANWLNYVNQPLTSQELARLTTSENRNRPYGQDNWVRQVVGKLGLQHTVRNEGRPAAAKPNTPTNSSTPARPRKSP